jgi:xylulokinase
LTLLGIDVGTTGCKIAAFSLDGTMPYLTYREYDIQRPHRGWAELDAAYVWTLIKEAICEVTAHLPTNSIQALAVSSMAEAVVPVTNDREILGPSLLNFDMRGEDYLDDLRAKISDRFLYQVNGNTLGNHYTLTKLKWHKQHQAECYDQADKFLPWSGFVSFMLGADPVTDYSLANRTLLFDLDRGTWSNDLVKCAGLDLDKLPQTVPSATPIGTVASHIADELGLSHDTVIVSGAHDQCATAVGCGVIEPGSAVCGMGTYMCIAPVFATRVATEAMIERGLNTEHHAVPDRLVTFIYNHGGSIVKWFRNTFAHEEHRQAKTAGQDIYTALFAEISDAPSPVIVLPHFSSTGPPDFVSDSCGVMVGLRLTTPRSAILKGIVEGITYYLKECVDALPATGITINDYRVAGGGSKSDVWVQTCADIMGRPFNRPTITEAGTLGAAIIAGVGSGIFSSFDEGVGAMVNLERCFEPDQTQHQHYMERYEQYKRLWPLMNSYLREIAADTR